MRTNPPQCRVGIPDTQGEDGIDLTGKESSRTRSTTEGVRAGAGTPSASRSVNGTTKTHGRANSYASSTLTRSASAASRPRGPLSSSTMGRPNTSMSTSRRPNGYSIPRPATSLDTHEEENSRRVLGKRKGMHTSYFLLSRPTSPVPLFSSWQARLDSQRETRGAQPSLSPLLEPCFESPHNESSICTPMGDLSLGPFPCEITIPNMFPKHDRAPIFTPSKIPVPKPALLTLSGPQFQHNHSAKKKRAPSPGFLNKETKIKAFNFSTGGEWDQDAREQNMEYLLSSFVSQLNQHGQASSGLKEAVEVYKLRGK